MCPSAVKPKGLPGCDAGNLFRDSYSQIWETLGVNEPLVRIRHRGYFSEDRFRGIRVSETLSCSRYLAHSGNYKPDLRAVV